MFAARKWRVGTPRIRELCVFGSYNDEENLDESLSERASYFFAHFFFHSQTGSPVEMLLSSASELFDCFLIR